MDGETFDDDQRIVQEIAGRFGVPSFVRRAKQVEVTWADLLSQLARLRCEQLEMVRLRLGQLHALAGGWEALRPLLADENDIADLIRLHMQLQPRLRMPLEMTTSRWRLRSALHELIEAMEMFNQRWTKLLPKANLKPVNDARDAYNRYYLLEKECALGSARTHRLEFKRLEPASVEDLYKEFPLLPVPRLAS